VRQHPLVGTVKCRGRTLERVALELRVRRTLQVGGKAVPIQCDPYSLYVQLVAEPVIVRYHAAVEGAGERCDRQYCAREHGCGGEVVRGAQRSYGSGGRGMWLAVGKLAA
jgi:hypothetical protein